MGSKSILRWIRGPCTQTLCYEMKEKWRRNLESHSEAVWKRLQSGTKLNFFNLRTGSAARGIFEAHSWRTISHLAKKLESRLIKMPFFQKNRKYFARSEQNLTGRWKSKQKIKKISIKISMHSRNTQIFAPKAKQRYNRIQ